MNVSQTVPAEEFLHDFLLATARRNPGRPAGI